MPYKPNGLALQVTGIRVQGPPARSLHFELQLFTNFAEPVVILGSEVRVMIGGYEIGSGNLLRAYTPPALGAAFGNANEVIGSIIVPLSREAIDWIEARRIGDLEYSLSVATLLAPVNPGDPATLGVPWNQHAENRYSSSIRDHIPVSEWLKHLRSLGWDETLLFELPAGTLNQSFPAAQARLDEAITHYRSGNWEETMISCRKLIDALAATKTVSGSKPDPTKLREFFEDGKKGDAINDIVYHFGQFLHLARHEHLAGQPVRISRADALMSLGIASTFLRYVSS